jgi:general secretion pathway protein G
MAASEIRTGPWILLGALVAFAALIVWALYHFVIGPGLMSNVVRQRQAAAQTQILEISKELEGWSATHRGEYPPSLEALGGAAREPDPWGNPWKYAPPGPGELRPTLRSLGRDGLPGGIGEDADIDREGLPRTAR